MSCRARGLLLTVATTVVGCTHVFDDADYDRACDVAEDRVLIAEGDRCDIETCGCTIAAIATAAKADYDADVAATACFDPLKGTVECLCPVVEAACEAGVCVVRGLGPAPDQ